MKISVYCFPKLPHEATKNFRRTTRASRRITPTKNFYTSRILSPSFCSPIPRLHPSSPKKDKREGIHNPRAFAFTAGHKTVIFRKCRRARARALGWKNRRRREEIIFGALDSASKHKHMARPPSPPTYGSI